MSKAISGLSRGLFGGSDQQSQQTSSSSLDPRVFGLMQENYDKAKGVASGLGVRQFAGFNPMQQQAFNQIGVLNAGFGDSLGAAQQALAGQAKNPFLGGAISQYMNPYTNDVINATMGDLERSRQLQQQQVNANAISRGAFGGSRQAVAEAENDRNFMDTQARTSAQLRSQGFDTALNAAQNDAARQQQAFSLMNNSFLGNLQAMLGAGEMQQGMSQQQLDAIRNLPLEQLQVTSGALGINPFGGAGNVSSGQGTSSGTSDKGLFGAFLG